MLPQAELTMNMLRGSRMNPKLSAWDQVGGVYDYNSTPIGPPGTRVLVHEKPNHRGTWAPHGEDAWYIGPSFEHYRCYKVWVWETRRERDTDTLSWFPHGVRMPTPSATDRISAGINDIATALQHPTPGSPLSPLTTSQVAALQDLLALLTPTPDDEALDHIIPTPPSDERTPPTTVNSPHAPRLRVEPAPEGGEADPLTYRGATKRKPRGRPRQLPNPPATATPTPNPAASVPTATDLSSVTIPRRRHHQLHQSSTR